MAAHHLPEPAPRITLRGLPLAARLVLSVFLIAVGLGYFSAMVQLHMKHSSREGEPLPSGADVVEVFAGLKRFNPDAPAPCARIDTLLTANPDALDVGKDNMAPAFYAKSKGWAGEQAKRGRGDIGTLRGERDGELQAMLAWVRSDPEAKKAAYENDSFQRPEERSQEAITPKYLAADGTVKVKTLVADRCQYCHAAQAPKLDTWADLEPLVTPPSWEIIDGKWVRSTKQTSVEHLTQSTHAHLLTFAILFALTGLGFAFTTYWTGVRLVLAPIVLFAQVIDISFWWLARVPHYGVYFAYGILGTGAVVGVGMTMQIVLSLLNMYGPKGKVVVMVVLFGVASALAIVGLKVIQPALDLERSQADALKATAAKVEEIQKAVEPVPPGGGAPKVSKAEPSRLEKLVAGPVATDKDHPFSGKGTMAPAFFEKDGANFKKDVKTNPALKDQREGERRALLAWILATPAEREKAYADDSFPLPPTLAGKPITPNYLTGSRAAKVKSILTDRCARCHSEGGEQSDYPLETYDQIRKYLEPNKDAGKEILPLKD